MKESDSSATPTGPPVSVFPRATSLYLDTGNVVNWDKLKRRTNLSPSDELKICAADSLSAWLAAADLDAAQTDLVVRCIDEKHNPVVDKREELKFTLKLFLYQPLSPSDAREAVEFAMTQLGLNYAEILVVSFPEDLETALAGSDVLRVWSALEELVDDGMLLSLGVSDLNKDNLEALHGFVRVKPSVDQISSTACCVIPDELKAFAAANDVQLLMHSDHKEFLSEAELRKVVGSVAHERDGQGWTPVWVLRYSSLAKGRGVIKSKGYTLKAKRVITFE